MVGTKLGTAPGMRRPENAVLLDRMCATDRGRVESQFSTGGKRTPDLSEKNSGHCFFSLAVFFASTVVTRMSQLGLFVFCSRAGV